MTGRKGRIDEIFLAARELSGEARAEHLRGACGGDAELRAEVEALLRADARADRLEPPTNEDLGVWLQGADSLAGQRVGDCTLVRRLASGGMGVVYVAEQDEPQRTVAVKLMRSALLGDDSRARFRHEVRALGSLTHPGIAQVFAAGTHEADAVPYFVMEFVAGARSLTAYCETEQTDGDARVELFTRVCDAVHFGHLKGVVHRDLKPDNILVGEDGQPKVIDFGIAKITDPELAQTKALTRTGEVFGTLQYLSPEQLAGDPDRIDARSDVYSLGVVLYELLTGRLPYPVKGKDLIGIAQVIAQQPPRFPAVGGDLDVVLGKALAKEPERRYASAAALRDDLARVLAGQPIEARPPSVGYQLRLLARRHKGVVAAGSIAVVALVAGTIVSLVMASRARDEAGRAESETRRARGAERRATDEAARARTAEATAREAEGKARAAETTARAAEGKARAEAERATALWLESQRVTNTVAGELFARIAYLPGSLGAREYIAEWLEGALERLTPHAEDDAALRRLAALRYIRLGEIHGQHGMPNLGNTKRALEAVERAIELFDPKTDAVDLAIARVRAADLVLRAGDMKRATALEKQAREALEAADQSDPRVLRNLVHVYVNGAQRVDRLNAVRQGIGWLERAADRGHALVALEPDRPANRLLVSRALGLLAQRFVRVRDFARADKRVDEAFAVLAAVEKKLPAAALESPRSLLQYYRGDINFFQGRYAKAQEAYEKSVGYLKSSLAREPRDRRARNNIATILSRLSATHVIQGGELHQHPLHPDGVGDDPKKKQALAHFQRAVELSREEVAAVEELRRLDPDAIDRVYTHHAALAGLVSALTQVQRWTEAVEVGEQALELARELRERDPTSVQAELAEFTIYHRWSAMFTFRAILDRDPKQAQAFLQRSLAEAKRAHGILTKMHGEGRLPPFHRRLIPRLEAQMTETKRNLERIKARIEKD